MIVGWPFDIENYPYHNIKCFINAVRINHSIKNNKTYYINFFNGLSEDPYIYCDGSIGMRKV